MIITSVIAVLILVAFASHGREETAPPEKEADPLFYAQDFETIDSISMYGDPRYWDDEKNLSLDMDGDGQNDVNFAISSSRSEGIDLKGSVRQKDGSWKSMNFWSSDLYRLYRDSLKEKAPGLFSLLQEGKYIVKGGSITENASVQISVCDIDQDGTIEVLASVGNQKKKFVTAVYELTRTGDAPFRYRGYLTGE